MSRKEEEFLCFSAVFVVVVSWVLCELQTMFTYASISYTHVTYIPIDGDEKA